MQLPTIITRLIHALVRPRGSAVYGRRLRDNQSVGFAIDLCHLLQEELTEPGEIRLSLLDVGPRSASGSNVVAQVFHPESYSRVKLDVTALDIEDELQLHATINYPDVSYRVGDVMDSSQRFDVVTCSHTLEHLAAPGPVLDHLRRIARQMVVIAAPYRERLHPSIPNPSCHLYSFDDAFFAEHVPRRLIVYSSPHWSSGDCFIAVYDPLPDDATNSALR